MRRRWTLAMAVLVLAGLAGWWLWPAETPEPELQPARTEAKQPARRSGRGELLRSPSEVEQAPASSAGQAHRAFLEDHGFTLVTCALSASVPPTRGEGWWAEGEEVVFSSAQQDEGSTWVVLGGYVPVLVRWSLDEGCAPDPVVLEPGSAVVEGRVEDAAGQGLAGAVVKGCGGSVRADAEGAFRGEFVPGSCALQALSGQLASEPVELTPVLGEVVEVVLRMPEAVRVEGLVRNTAGNPETEVFVSGCGVRVFTDADGRFEVLIEGWRCELSASRADGALRSRDRVEVEGEPGDTLQVELVIDEYPRGGLGVAFRMVSEGAEIVRVVPGGAAEQAGLVEGMVIVEVDGEPTADMAQDEFVDQATGEDGTDVEITLDDGSRVVLNRQPVGG